MTTSSEDFFLGPEYWYLNCLVSDGSRISEHGFVTLNAVLGRLRSLQLSVHPSTIESIEMQEIYRSMDLAPETQEELDYLDQSFLAAMENPRK